MPNSKHARQPGTKRPKPCPECGQVGTLTTYPRIYQCDTCETVVTVDYRTGDECPHCNGELAGDYRPTYPAQELCEHCGAVCAEPEKAN